MIQLKSFLKVVDNSGALIAECINIIGNKKVATIGDEIVVAIKKSKGIDQQKLKKGDVSRALIVRTCKEISRKDGTRIKFDDNACVMLNKQKQPLGTRIIGPIALEVRQKNWSKVVSMAPRIL